MCACLYIHIDKQMLIMYRLHYVQVPYYIWMYMTEMNIYLYTYTGTYIGICIGISIYV